MIKPTISIKELKKQDPKSVLGKSFILSGWVRSARHQKEFSFIELNDGSCFSSFQIIANNDCENYQSLLPDLTTGCSVAIEGTIAESPGANQSIEMKAAKLHLYGKADSDYPLQKKRHSFEFLRSIAHLRHRTNTFGAVARVRNALSFATHQFFQESDFLYIHTPLITASDCEGAGELFSVTSLPLDNIPKENGAVDYSKDFFSKPAYLTVSGQLNAECYASGLSKVYTFGPTFRAENSHTSRHLAEFWMIEPEVAFIDLDDLSTLSEKYLKYCIKHLLDHCSEDMNFFNSFIEKGLIDRLENLIKHPFERISYSDAISILEKSNKKFEFEVKWGLDLQSEHERYLSEEHFKKAVILTDYPKEIKAFYMKDNNDGKTVAALDVLAPKIGEVIGGSIREDRLDVLHRKIDALGLPPENFKWYTDLRRYGSVPHGGFGLGFERLILLATGMENIRDVIPFPRTPGNAEF